MTRVEAKTVLRRMKRRTDRHEKITIREWRRFWRAFAVLCRKGIDL